MNMQNTTQLLRRAFGSFMTGVTVVTTTDKHGNPIGFTANSFTSVSMDPPLLLVCPGNHLTSFDVFNSVTHFAVNVLAEGQESVSNTFASDIGDRFAQTSWAQDSNGLPLIEGACATFSCSVHQRHIAGDHMVLIGAVIDFTFNDQRGLGYSSKGYFSLSKEQQANAPSQSHMTSITGAIITSENNVLVVEDEQGLTLPGIEQLDASGARSALSAHLNQSDLNVSLGPVYSIYDDTANNTRYTYFLGTTSVACNNELGTFVKIDSLDTDNFSDNAQSVMMSRFVNEVKNNVFGLYVGDAESGDVHHPNHTQD